MAREISIEELEVAISQGVTLIDVREPSEFESGHVPGARLIPLDTLSENLELLPKEEQLFIVCQAGGRSMKAANYLEANGFAAVSVAGGTGEWISSGKAVSYEPSR